MSIQPKFVATESLMPVVRIGNVRLELREEIRLTKAITHLSQGEIMFTLSDNCVLPKPWRGPSMLNLYMYKFPQGTQIYDDLLYGFLEMSEATSVIGFRQIMDGRYMRLNQVPAGWDELAFQIYDFDFFHVYQSADSSLVVRFHADRSVQLDNHPILEFIKSGIEIIPSQWYECYT
jgi:hypothetical protein